MMSKPNQRSITITLGKDRLLYDITNECHILADTSSNEDAHARHNIHDIAENGNKDFLNSEMDAAYYDLQERLFPWTKEPMEHEEAEEELIPANWDFFEEPWKGEKVVDQEEEDLRTTEDKYVFKMNANENISKTSPNRWKWLMHQYIVKRCVSEWLSIVDPADKRLSVYALKANDLWDKLSESLTPRMRGLHLRSFPFENE